MGQLYSANVGGWTPAGIADNAQASNNNYHALKTWAATGVARIIEVFIGGEATSSTVNRMAHRRALNANTPTNVAPMYTGGVSIQGAANAQQYVVATGGPFATNLPNGHLLNLAFNAFGGVVRWVAAPGEELYQFGTANNNSETFLASISGTGIVSDHIIFEEL